MPNDRGPQLTAGDHQRAATADPESSAASTGIVGCSSQLPPFTTIGDRITGPDDLRKVNQWLTSDQLGAITSYPGQCWHLPRARWSTTDPRRPDGVVCCSTGRTMAKLS